MRRVPLAAEVRALETEVGGDQQFVALRRAQNGAIVANAEGEMWHTRLYVCANLLDELSFGQQHESSFKFRVSSFKLKTTRAAANVFK